MVLNGSFPVQIIERTWRLQHELELIGNNSIVLNDLATIIYGIPRIINEIRIIVSGNNVEEIANAISNVLGMYSYSDQLIDILYKRGSVAINPVTIPVVYIILAKSEIEKRCIYNSLAVDVIGYRILVPPLEEYVSYLLSLKAQYPYIIDAIALAILHSKRINIDRLFENRLDIEELCKLINDIGKKASIFYELGSLFEKAIESYCKYLSRKE